MGYTKLVRVHCDGPDCHKAVYGDTVEDARRIARYSHGWHSVRKYGMDFHSKECDQKWYDLYKLKQNAAIEESDGVQGELDLAAVTR